MSSAIFASLSWQLSMSLTHWLLDIRPRTCYHETTRTSTSTHTLTLTLTLTTYIHTRYSHHSQEACRLSSDYCSTVSARGSMSFVAMVPFPGLATELIRRHLGPTALPSRALPAYRHAGDAYPRTIVDPEPQIHSPNRLITTPYCRFSSHHHDHSL
ncbi:hypothetical protein CCMA1212_000991 [Trichoderma ghanense]|uniref:Secreted protein n=1 Tax=Trichoderma ghanense TaxID=65468 RepID=A0ABY2HG59_9HYPO